MQTAPLILSCVVALGLPLSASGQSGATPKPAAPADVSGVVSPADVRTAVGRLGSFEFPVRMDAARTVRRAAPAVAVPILVEIAGTQGADWYVRFRALVLLSGFNDPRTGEMMTRALADKNDRLRALAYSWFEHHQDPAVVPRLLAALAHEGTEFVRPALTRTLAAYAADPKVREAMTGLVMKGQDLFRAVAIEALGERRALFALAPIMKVATLEGPLQDDAVLAIGRIGDRRGLTVLADLQQTAPRTLQPSIAAAICLLGSNCGSHTGYLLETLTFAIANPGHQELLRATAGGLAALAVAGRAEAAAALFERGAPTRDPERAAIALALGTIALRNPPLLLQVLATQADLRAATDLLREAFDMLEEDFEEERFFGTVRRAYWAAPAGSRAKTIAETLIQRLEF